MKKALGAVPRASLRSLGACCLMAISRALLADRARLVKTLGEQHGGRMIRGVGPGGSNPLAPTSLHFRAKDDWIAECDRPPARFCLWGRSDIGADEPQHVDPFENRLN
jgi:hypothetical protein